MRGPEDENTEDECASEEECEIDWGQMPGFDDDNDNDSDDNDLEMLALSQVNEEEEEEEIVLYNDFENDLEIPLSSSSSSPSSQDLVDQRVSASTTSTVGSAASASTVGGANKKKNNKKNKNINWKHGMVNMEMSWQMQEAAKECNVDLSPATCGSEVCETCRGTGKVPCRGCRGTGYFKLQGMKDFVVCPLCSNHHNANDNKNHRPGFETCSSCQGTGWIAEWTLLTSATVGHHAPASSKGGEGGAGDSSSKHNGGNQDHLLP